MKVKKLSVKDGYRLCISDFPNFHASGSIKGMKDKFYGHDALLVRCGQYIYYVGNLMRTTNSQVSSRGETIYFHEAH